ncbi:TPA: hypothetical protein ACXEW6_004709 [Enterobacter hormaechei]
MIKNPKAMVIAMAFCIISATFIYMQFFHTTKGPINCTADASMHFKDADLKLTYTVRMNKGDGLISMLGTLEHNKTETDKVSRQIYFDYTADRFYYHFVSNKAIKSENDTVADDVLAKYTPDFFIMPGKVRDFDIIPTNKSGWVFLMHSIPFIQCNNMLDGK